MNDGKGGGILVKVAVTAAVVAIFVWMATVLGGSLLKFLGMQYHSFWSVFLFFIVYYIVDYPIDILVDGIPRALRSAGRLPGKWAEMLLYAALDVPVNCLVMLAIDYFMSSITIPTSAILVFSSILCAVNLYLGRSVEKGYPIRIFLWEKQGEKQPASRELLLESLTLYCEENGDFLDADALRIEEGPHGKPFAARRIGEQWVPRKDLFFSVSHTPRWWLCAVHNAPIGVDIEEQGRRVSLEVAERFFTEEEQGWLAQMGKTKDHFLELWVRKEAYVKFLGTGLVEGLRSFSAVSAEVVEVGKGMEKTVFQLAKTIGKEGTAVFCTALFPEGIRDPQEYPVPLIGAFCTSEVPDRIEIGFLERGNCESDDENEIAEDERK